MCIATYSSTISFLIIFLGLIAGCSTKLNQPPMKDNAFYQKDCDAGDVFACTHLGLTLEMEGVQKGSEGLLEEEKEYFDKAERLYSKACQGGEMIGCYNFGLRKEKKRHFAEAARAYNDACKAGREEACKKLAEVGKK